MRVAHVQQVVHERLRDKGITSVISREVVDILVWETMAVLGEWQFVDLEVPPEALDKEGS